MVPQAYTNLSIFKRIEIWILLALTVAGLVFVLSTRPTTGSGDPSSGTDKAKTPEGDPATRDSPATPTAFKKGNPLEAKSVTVTREADRFLARVTFSYNNESDQPIHTIAGAYVFPESKRPASPFFLAFEGAPPIIPAKKKTDNSLTFSLNNKEIAGELTLRVAGFPTLIKSSRSFDPESIAIGSSKTFTQLDW